MRAISVQTWRNLSLAAHYGAWGANHFTFYPTFIRIKDY